MQTLKIGQLSFELHEKSPPPDFSPETDALKEAQKLNDNLHRLVWWSGRVSYVIGSGRDAVTLSLGAAIAVSREIAADDAARRTQPHMRH